MEFSPLYCEFYKMLSGMFFLSNSLRGYWVQPVFPMNLYGTLGSTHGLLYCNIYTVYGFKSPFILVTIFTWSLYFTDLLILESVVLALIWPYSGSTQISVTHHLFKSSLVSK